jgi:hypothetical protein
MIPRTELVAVPAETPLRDLTIKIGQGDHAAAVYATISTTSSACCT